MHGSFLQRQEIRERPDFVNLINLLLFYVIDQEDLPVLHSCLATYDMLAQGAAQPDAETDEKGNIRVQRKSADISSHYEVDLIGRFFCLQ